MLLSCFYDDMQLHCVTYCITITWLHPFVCSLKIELLKCFGLDAPNPESNAPKELGIKKQPIIK